MGIGCVLICVEDKTSLVLGQWQHPEGKSMLDCEFWWPNVFEDDGSRCTPDRMRRVIEVFLAQSDGKTVRLIGENEHWELLEDESWRQIELASEVLSREADPPKEKYKLFGNNE